MTTKVIFITSGTTYTIPSDFGAFVSVECIGGGGSGAVVTAVSGGGRGGGGGGAYAKSTAVTGLVAGGTAWVNIGAAAGITWFNGTSNANPTTTAQGARAAGGTTATTASGAAGGTTAASIGTTTFAGGAGGAGADFTGFGTSAAGGGGGGAGGTTANGTAGGAGVAPNATSFTGGGGGAGGATSGGTTAGSGATGNAGTVWTATAGGTAGAGSGGGGGGATSAPATQNGGTGGLYGGGGGSGNPTAGTGRSGIVVFTYTDTATLYWVGGNGTWDATTKTNWALTSGGAGGAGVPSATNPVVINGSSGSPTITLTGALACASLTTTGATCTFTSTGTLTISGSMTLSATTTWSATGALTFNATGTITTNGVTIPAQMVFNGASQTFTLGGNITCTNATTSPVTFTNGTLNLNNFTLTVNTFASSNTNTRVIAFGTSGKIVTVGIGTTAQYAINGTNLSYTGTSNLNISAPGTGANNLSINLSTGFTETNAMNVSITTGSYSLAETPTSVYKNLNFTGFSGTLTGAARTIYGNLTIASAATYSQSANATTFAATSGTQTITSNGETLEFPITIGGVGGTVVLGDDLTLGATRTLTLTNGTFNASGFNVTAGLFASNNSNTRTLTMGSGTWTLSGTGTVWNLATATNLTLNANTSTIVLSNTSTSARTFAGGGLTYNNLTIGGATGTSTLTFTGNNTFATLASTKTVAHTITLPASGTTTVSNWTISGTAGNVVTLNSSSAGTQSTLTKTGGGVISGIDYLSIQDSAATPSTTWYAGANSTNVSNNTGWIFANYVPSTGNFFLLF